MRTFLLIVGLIVAAITIAVVIAFVRPNTSSASASDSSSEPPTAPAATPKLSSFDAMKQGAIQARLEMEGRGFITFELYPKAAPKTVAHIVKLCKQHFYDGILVHRVEPNFVFQAGDPHSKKIDPAKLRGKTSQEAASAFNLGTSGSGTTVPLEAKLPNVAGSLGLARSEAENSGDSQFYVNLKDNKSLDGSYCVFGRMVSGQDIAPNVQIGDRIKSFTVLSL